MPETQLALSSCHQVRSGPAHLFSPPHLPFSTPAHQPICPTNTPLCPTASTLYQHQVLLSLDFDDDWVDNPVVAASWAITWEFKEAFDDAFEVSEEVVPGQGC